MQEIYESRKKMSTSKQMTSRERVLTSLNFQIPDRVPIDLGGFQSGIHKKAYEELLSYLGKKEEIVMLDPVQQLVRPSEEILEMLKVDFRYVTAKAPDSFEGTIKQNFREGELWHDLRDEFGVIWSMPERPRLSLTAAVMMTSSPCFQSAGVATAGLELSWSESMTRRISSKLRPQVIG